MPSLLKISLLLGELALIIIPAKRMFVQERLMSELYSTNQATYNMAADMREKYKPISTTLILIMLLIFWLSIIVANKYGNMWLLLIGISINFLHFWIDRFVLDQMVNAIPILSSIHIEFKDDDDESDDEI
ncbi:hypothetical protein [Limosilactobacillus mucosae]|uniref:hypothetical protein n=1 Tax=Limosilactobacillus mucosae TaxID=97478 RepID=UPI00233EAF4F|nr:hypothetical protein [Limosilactobacillus mucosae]MDC2842313.1 hypothetical protein [Limosilactobacillus mucosae]